MPRAEPEKRAAARRLVEQEGVSLAEAARRVKVNPATVRAWQKADERAGDPWRLGDPHSIAVQAMDRARTEEERQELVERARQANQVRWENRRRGEADAAGVAASSVRVQLMNVLPHIGRSAVEGGDADTEGLRAQRLSGTAKNLAIAYGVLLDKADALTGAREVAVTDPWGDDALAHDDARSQVVDILRRVS